MFSQASAANKQKNVVQWKWTQNSAAVPVNFTSRQCISVGPQDVSTRVATVLPRYVVSVVRSSQSLHAWAIGKQVTRDVATSTGWRAVNYYRSAAAAAAAT